LRRAKVLIEAATQCCRAEYHRQGHSAKKKLLEAWLLK
jgi:hypothetical protein